jgi:hypothetical protein
VIAVKEAGIKALPDIFNAGLLIFVLSAANAGKLLSAKSEENNDKHLQTYTLPPGLYMGFLTTARPRSCSAARISKAFLGRPLESPAFFLLWAT